MKKRTPTKIKTGYVLIVFELWITVSCRLSGLTKVIATTVYLEPTANTATVTTHKTVTGSMYNQVYSYRRKLPDLSLRIW